MQWRSTNKDWGAVAKFLHWAMAACIMIMIVMGIMMKWYLAGDQASQFQAYQLHKSFGFTLLMFAIGVRALASQRCPCRPLRRHDWHADLGSVGYVRITAERADSHLWRAYPSSADRPGRHPSDTLLGDSFLARLPPRGFGVTPCGGRDPSCGRVARRCSSTHGAGRPPQLGAATAPPACLPPVS
jgi:hypothetical protein